MLQTKGGISEDAGALYYSRISPGIFLLLTILFPWVHSVFFLWSSEKFIDEGGVIPRGRQEYSYRNHQERPRFLAEKFSVGNIYIFVQGVSSIAFRNLILIKISDLKYLL